MGPGASKAREYSLARQGLVRVELVRLVPRDEVLAGRYQGVVGGIATSTTPCHARGRRRGACRCLLPSPSWHPSRCLLPSRPLPGPGVLPSPSWHPDALRTMTRPHEAKAPPLAPSAVTSMSIHGGNGGRSTWSIVAANWCSNSAISARISPTSPGTITAPRCHGG